MSIEVSVQESRRRLDQGAALLADVREPCESAPARAPHERLTAGASIRRLRGLAAGRGL